MPCSTPPHPAVCSVAVMLKPELVPAPSDTNSTITWGGGHTGHPHLVVHGHEGGGRGVPTSTPEHGRGGVGTVPYGETIPRTGAGDRGCVGGLHCAHLPREKVWPVSSIWEPGVKLRSQTQVEEGG